ncbi:hypothetical protein Tco_0508691 [Tanacetum coccineum]
MKRYWSMEIDIQNPKHFVDNYGLVILTGAAQADDTPLLKDEGFETRRKQKEIKSSLKERADFQVDALEMTGTRTSLSDFKEFKGVMWPWKMTLKEEEISGKGTINDILIDFEKSAMTAFEKEQKRTSLEKGKECVDSTFTLSTANTPPQSTGNTPIDSDDDILKDEEPKKVSQALADESWVEAMQEEVLQFKLQEGTDKRTVWIMMKWIAPVARIEAIRLFWHFTIFHGLHCFEDPSHQQGQQSCQGTFMACLKPQKHGMERLPTFFEHNIGEGAIDKTQFIKKDRMRYHVGNRTIKPASTPIEAHKSLGKDEEGEDVDVPPDQSAAKASVINRTLNSRISEGLLDLYALNREVMRLKKQTLSQAKLIRKLKAKLKNLSKVVAPVVKHHAFWVESQHLQKQKRRRKKQKKKVSSVKLGRNKEEGLLSEEHNSDETEEINVEEKEASNVKSGDTEELDLETFQNQEALETTNDEEVAKRILAEWDAEEERKGYED